MDKDQTLELLVRQIRDYAAARASDVARGAETPYLAALLVQKYGQGVADAAATIFDNARAADPVSLVVDEEVEKLDPDWRKHDQLRWAARPADVGSIG